MSSAGIVFRAETPTRPPALTCWLIRSRPFGIEVKKKYEGMS